MKLSARYVDTKEVIVRNFQRDTGSTRKFLTSSEESFSQAVLKRGKLYSLNLTMAEPIEILLI